MLVDWVIISGATVAVSIILYTFAPPKLISPLVSDNLIALLAAMPYPAFWGSFPRQAIFGVTSFLYYPDLTEGAVCGLTDA